MEKSVKIKRMTGIAIFAGLVIALQLFSNYVSFGPVSITLALIPIVVGAIIYGPFAGFILGCVCGFIVFVGPVTIQLFWPYGILITLLVCVFKTGIAGAVSGLIYKYLNKQNNKVAVILASIIVPIVNTGLFAIAAYVLYYDLLTNLMGDTSKNVVAYLLFTFIGYNFIIEFLVNSVLSPTILRLTKVARENFSLGEK